MRLLARGVTLTFERPLVMGIVNLSADSFSNDGLPDPEAAVEHARQLVADGADLIDVGAESARTNRGAIAEAEEAGRLLEFVERWDAGTPLSINTWRPGAARAVLARGGHLLNDIGGLPSAENARICAETGAALLIMHTVGEPKVAHTHVRHSDILQMLREFFAEKIAVAEAAGLDREAIVLDPGIDFAKQRDDNLRIYARLAELRSFERPILLPVSRKTVIGDVLDLPPEQRDTGTVACIVSGFLRGAHLFRVHNVQAAAQAIRTLSAVKNAS
jgi:dihydropteroate synthase